MSSRDYEEIIIKNNEEIKIENVLKPNNNKNKKRANHLSFFMENDDYLSNSDKNRVVCVKCTDTFFNIFFNDQRDENDQVMQEIFKSKYFMTYIPEEQVFKCPKCGKIEILRDPQISNQKEKKLLGAGIENYPEYNTYLDPDSIKGDYIVTANLSKKKQKPKPIFKEISENEIFDRFLDSKRS